MSYPAPILNLNFANAKQLVHPALAFSRASQGSYFDGNGILRYANNSVPRFDHDPLTGICKGLLVEPAVTFMDNYSEQFDNAAWTKTRASITPNAAIAPDGTMTADKLVEDISVVNTHEIFKSSTITAGAVTTYAVRIKKGERTKAKIWLLNESLNSGANFLADISTGVPSAISVIGTATNASCNIKELPDGYYECSITCIVDSSSTTIRGYVVLHNGATDVYTGDGTSGLYIWGAKLYAGTGPTSYLPTTTAGVTRAADLCTVDLANLTRNGSPLWGGTEGTIVVDFITPPSSLPSGSSQVIFSLYSAGWSESIFAHLSGGTSYLTLGVYHNSSNQLTGYGALLSSIRYRLALAFNSSGVVSSLNGSSVNTIAASTTSTATKLGIGQDVFGAQQLGGTIRSVQLYNRRIDDAYLPALSTL